MPIAFCSLELFLPDCHSLKEKRMVVQKTTHRLRSKFNFSIAEIEHQDTWQRARIGAVSIGSDSRKLQSLCEKLVREGERILGGDLVNSEIEIFDHD